MCACVRVCRLFLTLKRVLEGNTTSALALFNNFSPLRAKDVKMYVKMHRHVKVLDIDIEVNATRWRSCHCYCLI